MKQVRHRAAVQVRRPGPPQNAPLPAPREQREAAAATSFLRPGETCWRVAMARRAAVIVDAEAYFSLFRRAVLAAREQVLISAWDIDSRTRLTHDQTPSPAGPATLLPLFKFALERRPSLHIYVLAWDFSMIYLWEREFAPAAKFRSVHPRLHFSLDSAHASGGSHHQKLVVIDDWLAFAGGIDLTLRRWDTQAHAAHDGRRRDPAGVLYAPMHDVQMCVEGPVAKVLGALIRERYRDADLPPPPEPATGAGAAGLWPEGLPVQFHHQAVGISRTRTAVSVCSSDVREAKMATLEAIQRAERYIFLETQYLTAAAVVDALAERLGREEGPEVVAILPRHECGWLERSSLGAIRARALRLLRKYDRHGRFRVYYPYIPSLGDSCLNVHSKVIIVDDELLKIGSSNLSNRSLGLDSECDLWIHASHQQPEARQQIAQLLARLLAEHLDLPASALRAELDKGSLIGAVEACRGGRPRTLRVLEDDDLGDASLDELSRLVVDPERPMGAHAFSRHFFPTSVRRPAQRSLLAATALTGSALALGALWYVLDERDAPLLAQLVGLFRRAQTSLAAAATVSLLYAAATLMFVPLTLLVATAAVVLGGWQAVALSMIGALLGASLTYGLGRAIGPGPLLCLGAARVERARERLQECGFRATLVARMLPLGSFTLLNLVAGSLRVPFASFTLANVLGMLPGVLWITLLAMDAKSLFEDPSGTAVARVIGATLSLVLLLLGLARSLSDPPYERLRERNSLGNAGGPT